MDLIKAALVSAGLGATLLLAAAGVLAWNNAGSRNLALATGTVAAGLLLFALQLPFELRSTEERDFLTVELTLDRQESSIRQWSYASVPGMSWRIHDEIDASKWLAGHHPQLFADEDGRDRITRDLVLFSIVSYLARYEFDWQRRLVRFSGDTAGTILTWDRLSKASECTLVDEHALRAQLTAAANAYAGARLSVTGQALCLPPRTFLTLARDSLAIDNPFVRILLDLRPSGSISYIEPGTGKAPQMPSGGGRYETRLIGVEAKVTYRALRAQHRHMYRYKAWTQSLLTGLHQWFEIPQPDPIADA
jgi:hypothetical protein